MSGIEEPPDGADNGELMRSWLALTREAMRAEGIPEPRADRVMHRIVFGHGVNEPPPAGPVVSSGVIA
jgi:hypothetical protein